jgi:hypothetical protein
MIIYFGKFYNISAASSRTPLGAKGQKPRAPYRNRMNSCLGVCAITAVSLLGFPVWAQQTPAQPAASQAQTLRDLTRAQTEMVRPFLQQGMPSQEGDIRGFVEASLPGNPDLRDVALPGAQVFVQKAGGQPDQASMTSTDRTGRFRIPSRPPGSYNVCATLQGFTTGCYSIPIVNHNVSLPESISLKPIGTAIRGCVTFKDGTPAVRAAASPYQTAGYAEVSVVNDAGQVLAGPVPVNGAGCYVLPGVPDTPNLNVAVRYEDATARHAIATGALAPPNGSVVNVVLANAPPTITAFTATLGGKEVSQVPPGATVAAKVDATSPENYPLHYKWADSTGSSLPGDQASEQWRLPRTNSLNFLFVEVSDGHGGVARASLPISTGPIAGQSQPQTAPAGAPQRFNAIPPGSKPGSVAFPHPGQTFIDPTLFMSCSDATSCAARSKSYYQQLGVFDANGNPTGSFVNFKTWKAAWGFSDNPTNPGANETRAVFYNDGDLQFGRDMHCLAVTGLGDPATQFTAVAPQVVDYKINVCYVANFSDASRVAGGNPQMAVVNAENDTSPIAAVAMVGVTTQIATVLPPAGSWTNIPYVYFLVFAPSGTDPNVDDFVPNPAAVLDGDKTAKAVPGVCIACHGGTYSPSSNDVVFARFLPFDTPSYIYDQGNGRFSAASQSEAFRTLNIIVRNADTDGLGSPGGGAPNLITSHQYET